MSGHERDRLEQLDYYTLLQVPRDVAEPELRRAFRRFARKFHPDRFIHDPKQARRAEQIYRRGTEAFQVLLDPVSRRAYDTALRSGSLRLDAETRERAHAEARRSTGPRGRRDSLSQLRIPQVRRLYEEATRDWRAGRPRQAWRKLKAALEMDPSSEFLQRQFGKVDAFLRRGG